MSVGLLLLRLVVVEITGELLCIWLVVVEGEFVVGRDEVLNIHK